MISMDNSSFTFKAGDEDVNSISFLTELKKANILNGDGCLELKQVSAQEDAEDRIEICLATLEQIGAFAKTPIYS